MNWDLTYLFKDEKEFNSLYDEATNMLVDLESFKGKLNDEELFKKFLLLSKEFEYKAGKLYLFSHLQSDLNKKNVEYLATLSRAHVLFQKYSMAISFMEPEILAIGKEKVLNFIDNNKEIEEYRFSINKLFDGQSHILDAKSEQLLSILNPALGRSGDLYSALTVADGKGVEVELSGNRKVVVTQGNWRMLVADSSDAEDRKKIFEAIFNYYEQHKNAYATIYENGALKNKANAKARNYNSVLESYLEPNNIPTEVYLNLVDVASHKNDSLKKYLKLRKEYLGLEEHYSYDRFLELAKSDKKYTFEDAKAMFFDAIKDCPKDFQEKAHEALKDGFVDVFEKDGKRSGAYSSSMMDIHPFILLNFSGTLDDCFTVAHEAGHSMHTLYSEEAQPGLLQNYTIFVAEIASTFNEHLLLDYLMESDKITKNEKIMLLQKAIDEIFATFYRQTLFAEFELKANNLVENDQPINHEVLSNIMIDLYKQYYDLDIEKEKIKKYVWAYIPHLFYTPFYVYQYATSFAASFKLYKNVKENKELGFEKYLGLLKSGGSKYPMDEAIEAGVDFRKKDAYLAVVDRTDELVAKLEELLK